MDELELVLMEIDNTLYDMPDAFNSEDYFPDCSDIAYDQGFVDGLNYVARFIKQLQKEKGECK